MTPQFEKRDPLTYAIIGVAMAVHTELGGGMSEPIYQEAFELELEMQNLPFSREHPLIIYYKGRPLRSGYRADFLCYDAIIVELKSLAKLTDREEAQVLNYMKASRINKALLFNFGNKSLEFRRFVLGEQS